MHSVVRSKRIKMKMFFAQWGKSQDYQNENDLCMHSVVRAKLIEMKILFAQCGNSQSY